MKITKIGHCCLVVEVKGIRILTDPGMFTDGQNTLTGVDVLLITHEHGDHLHTDSVKEIVKNNPEIKIITNTAVGKILSEQGIKFEIVEDGQSQIIKEVLIEAFGNVHQEIYKDYGMVQNTGYFIDNYFYYPGDALHVPGKNVEVLALPVPGSWANMREVIDFAYAIKPKKAFPVHDSSWGRRTFIHNVFNQLLPKEGIEINNLEENQSADY